MKITEDQAEELYELTKFIGENEHSVDWFLCDEDNIYRPAVNLNDFFACASADLETIYGKDIPDIIKAQKDIADAMKCDDIFASIWSLELWAARKRGMRPQGAAYPKGDKEEPIRKLFDHCGPEREVCIINPKPRSERNNQGRN